MFDWVSVGGPVFVTSSFSALLQWKDELTMKEEVLYLKEFKLWELNNEFRYI